MNQSTFFHQLASYSSGIQNEVRSLRELVETEGYSVSSRSYDFSCIDTVGKRVVAVQDNLSLMENEVLGSEQNRDRHLSIKEILLRCCSALQSNASMIEKIEKHLADHGVEHSIMPTELPVAIFQTSNDGPENKENVADKPNCVNTTQSPNVQKFTKKVVVADSPQQSSILEHSPKTPNMPDWKLSEPTRRAIAELRQKSKTLKDISSDGIKRECNSLMFSSPGDEHNHYTQMTSPETPDSDLELSICHFESTRGNIACMSSNNRGFANSLNTSLGIVDFNSLENSPADEITSPHVTKLLQPRVNGCEDGWMPVLSAEDWDALPAFLKMQMTMEALNTVIDRLNAHIASVSKPGKPPPAYSSTSDVASDPFAVAPSSKQRLPTYTPEEMQAVIGDCVAESALKAVSLALVHLQRLDIYKENGIKVFKVRRFY